MPGDGTFITEIVAPDGCEKCEDNALFCKSVGGGGGGCDDTANDDGTWSSRCESASERQSDNDVFTYILVGIGCCFVLAGISKACGWDEDDKPAPARQRLTAPTPAPAPMRMQPVYNRPAQSYAQNPVHNMPAQTYAGSVYTPPVSSYTPPTLNLSASGPTCVKCRASIPGASQFCTGCGSRQPAAAAPVPTGSRCAGCGAARPPGTQFCTSCGHAAADPIQLFTRENKMMQSALKKSSLDILWLRDNVDDDDIWGDMGRALASEHQIATSEWAELRQRVQSFELLSLARTAARMRMGSDTETKEMFQHIAEGHARYTEAHYVAEWRERLGRDADGIAVGNTVVVAVVVAAQAVEIPTTPADELMAVLVASNLVQYEAAMRDLGVAMRADFLDLEVRDPTTWTTLQNDDTAVQRVP